MVYPLLLSTKMMGLTPSFNMTDNSCTVNCLLLSLVSQKSMPASCEQLTSYHHRRTRSFGSVQDPQQRETLQPSVVLAALALSTLMRSSEIELGAHGRQKALWLKDFAEKSKVDQTHVYTIDWSEDRIIWSVDGSTMRTIHKGQSKILSLSALMPDV